MSVLYILLLALLEQSDFYNLMLTPRRLTHSKPKIKNDLCLLPLMMLHGLGRFSANTTQIFSIMLFCFLLLSHPEKSS